MPFPSGVAVTRIIFGKGVAIDGAPVAATLTVEPLFGGSTVSVVWVADGTALLPVTATRQAESGNIGSVDVPVVDQDGWIDDGQNVFTMWAYRLTETVGRITRVKYVQPLSGQAEIDFDRIPDGTVGLPVSAPVAPVTSVAGGTGDVTAAHVADAVRPLIDVVSDEAIADAVTDYLAENPITGAEWGNLAGTLSDQTDLQEALDAKADVGDVPSTPEDIGAATAAQGALANTAVQPAALAEKENLLTAGANVTIDRTDPDNPVIAATGGGGSGGADWGEIGGTLASQGDLQAALDAKADADDLEALVPSTRTVGGHPLSADVELSKDDVGLGAADNTADVDKPVSTAQQEALNAKANTVDLEGYVPVGRTVAGQPLSDDVTLSKGDVGLGNVDNTADADKPISADVQEALDAKADSTLLGTAAEADVEAFATAAQGALADSAVQAGDLSDLARFVTVSTGSEARPAGGFVIWLDMREGEVSVPANMGASDVRFRPGSVTPIVTPPTITTTTVGGLAVDAPVNITLAATGGSPITWAVTAGALPAGCTLSSAGVLTGTPTTEGAYDFTVTATNSAGSDTQQYTGTVSAAPEPSEGITFWGATAPGTTGTITLESDGGGSLRTGTRFISDVPINVIGARLWNPPGSDSTFLNTDATVYAYVENYTGSFVTGITTFAGTPVASKVHTDVRVAGQWTEILFDSPVAVAATSTATGALLTLAVLYAGGNYYVNVPYVGGGNDQVLSPESEDVVIPSYDEATGAVHNLAGNGGRATDTIYGIDLIFEGA